MPQYLRTALIAVLPAAILLISFVAHATHDELRLAHFVDAGDTVIDTENELEYLKFYMTENITIRQVEELVESDERYAGFQVMDDQDIKWLYRSISHPRTNLSQLYYADSNSRNFQEMKSLVEMMGSFRLPWAKEIAFGAKGATAFVAYDSYRKWWYYYRYYPYYAYLPYKEPTPWTTGYARIGDQADSKDDLMGPFWMRRKLVTNTPPYFINNMGGAVIHEGQSLELQFEAGDADNDNLVFSFEPLPYGAVFNSGNGSFQWTPSFEQAGEYKMLLGVIDDGQPSMSSFEEFAIVVGNVNRAPVISDITPISAEENTSISVSIQASDPDLDFVTLTAYNLPAGSTFSDSVFSWKPGFLDAGTYIVDFVASDGGLETTSSLTLSIGETTNPLALCAFNEEYLLGMALENNVRNSYLANNKKVCFFIEKGKLIAARNQLQATEHKIAIDLETNVLSQDQVSDLLRLIGELRALISND